MSYYEYSPNASSGDAASQAASAAASSSVGKSDSISFRVPNYIAGSIIGAGGAVIKSIRAESGAKVIVDPPQPGSSERYVSIAGSEDQILAAQALIQKRTGWGDFGPNSTYGQQ